MEEKFYAEKSSIHGMGLFTSVNIKKGEEILQFADLMRKTIMVDWITNAGKLVNHQTDGNTVMQRQNHLFILIASKDISAGEELTTNYKLLQPDVFSTDVTNFTEK